MKVTTVVVALLLHYVVLISWFPQRATPLSLSTPMASAITLTLVATAAGLKGALGKKSDGISYLVGAFLAGIVVLVTATAAAGLWVGRKVRLSFHSTGANSKGSNGSRGSRVWF